jgi:PhzF family phenazine biosynthesis protein
MKIPYYQVNAFTGKGVKGNPAGVCLINNWLSNTLMQNIATENNLSETAFVVRNGDHFGIRWFTPTIEVDLCGHATLASAFVILEYIDTESKKIKFISKSGELVVDKKEKTYSMNFPVDIINSVAIPEIIRKSFNDKPLEVFKGKTDYMLIFSNEQQIRSCQPDIDLLKKCDGRGVIVTAPGKEFDFVSRFFAPQSGIPEDPVTGSAHTTLVPYWSKKLRKDDLSAQQLSMRGGKLLCRNHGERIEISGNCEIYIEGYIFI